MTISEVKKIIDACEKAKLYLHKDKTGKNKFFLKCPKCNNIITDNNSYCEKCGQKIRKNAISYKIISNRLEKNLVCAICGETRSVKYSAEVIDEDFQKKEIQLCNRCVHMIP